MAEQPIITAARRALSLTIAVTYSNGMPDRWDSVPSGWSRFDVGRGAVRAVSNDTAGIG